MSLHQIREQFQAAAKSPLAIRGLRQALQEHPSPDSGLVLAYQAAATALEADQYFNPISKLRHFRQALSLFDKAIKRDPDHPEVRFLRFIINTNTPTLLQEHIEEDKRMLVKGMMRYRDFDLSKEDVEAFWRECRQTGRFSRSEVDDITIRLSQI